MIFFFIFNFWFHKLMEDIVVVKERVEVFMPEVDVID